MLSPTTETLQDVTNVISAIGVISILIISIKLTRYLTRRELTQDAKLESIYAQVTLTQTNHVPHVQAAVDQAAEQARAHHSELLREIRDSNSRIIESGRNGTDRIVEAILRKN